jgi:hypothetical protein
MSFHCIPTDVSTCLFKIIACWREGSFVSLIPIYTMFEKVWVWPLSKWVYLLQFLFHKFTVLEILLLHDIHNGYDLMSSTLNCAFRWTYTNFLTFHIIQILFYYESKNLDVNFLQLCRFLLINIHLITRVRLYLHGKEYALF